MDRIGPRFFFCLKRGFFWENWPTLLFSTYCAPLCYNVSKKYWKIMRYKVLKFWTQLNTNYPLTPTWDFFNKISCYFCLLQIAHRNSIMIKKIIKTDQKIFFQNQNHFLWGKLTIVIFVNLLWPIILKCLNLKKNILTENHEIKVL